MKKKGNQLRHRNLATVKEERVLTEKKDIWKEKYKTNEDRRNKKGLVYDGEKETINLTNKKETSGRAKNEKN